MRGPRKTNIRRTMMNERMNLEALANAHAAASMGDTSTGL
jgi:hypothetical protein